MTDSARSVPANSAENARPPGRVVVGVDGSEGSFTALRWAITEAHLRGITVHAILAWRNHAHWSDPDRGSMMPLTYGAGMPGVNDPDLPQNVGEGSLAPAPGGRLGAEAAMRNVLDVAVAKATEGSEHPVPITQAVVEGHAANVLLEAVTESDLLVVGSRGHGEFSGALLGSISQHVVTHAPCPAVVVPEIQQSHRSHWLHRQH